MARTKTIARPPQTKPLTRTRHGKSGRPPAQQVEREPLAGGIMTTTFLRRFAIHLNPLREWAMQRIENGRSLRRAVAIKDLPDEAREAAKSLCDAACRPFLSLRVLCSKPLAPITHDEGGDCAYFPLPRGGDMLIQTRTRSTSDAEEDIEEAHVCYADAQYTMRWFEVPSRTHTTLHVNALDTTIPGILFVDKGAQKRPRTFDDDNIDEGGLADRIRVPPRKRSRHV